MIICHLHFSSILAVICPYPSSSHDLAFYIIAPVASGNYGDALTVVHHMIETLNVGGSY